MSNDSIDVTEGNASEPEWLRDVLAGALTDAELLADDEADERATLLGFALPKRPTAAPRPARSWPAPPHRAPGKPLWQLWAQEFANGEMHRKWRSRCKADWLELEQALGYATDAHAGWASIGLGHCGGTDYAWNEAYRMWLPGPDLMRRGFLTYLDVRRAQENEMGRDERPVVDDNGRPGIWRGLRLPTPDELTPTFIASVVDHCRAVRLALTSAQVAVTAPGRFLQPGEIGRRPPQRWLARVGGAPVLPGRGIGALYGYSESYKSYVAVNLAVALASGRADLAGLALDAPEGGWVLYVAAEDADGLDARIAAARRQLGAPDARVLLYDQPVVMTDGAAVLDLVLQARQALPPGAPVTAVVIDTYNQSLGAGDDENSADTARNYTLGMRLLERALDAVVVTIHHPPKGDGDQLRGSGALENNVDFAIRFEREEGAMRTRVSARKQKNGPKFDAFTVAFAAADDGLVMAGVGTKAGPRPEKAGKDPLLDHEQKALVFRALARAEPAGLTYTEWRAAASSAGTFSAAKAMMEDRELVCCAEGRYRLTTQGAAQAEGKGWTASRMV